MKTIKCDSCDLDIKGENFDDWFKEAQAHYGADHADLIKEMMLKPKEEGEKWMADVKVRFDAV